MIMLREGNIKKDDNPNFFSCRKCGAYFIAIKGEYALETDVRNESSAVMRCPTEKCNELLYGKKLTEKEREKYDV